jgi:hypothetical protein
MAGMSVAVELTGVPEARLWSPLHGIFAARLQ